ncbi:hypothetical protein GCK32_011157 [Trichostrongylus colubriformis]|uniref:Uncharacterized protein n=1 Tax=Trichostrongylus colubriformis TaxID=6319 RepID=A0AAN8FPW4_TRICO
MDGMTKQEWLGEKLVACRHNDYGYTLVEWLLMIVVFVLSVAVCGAAYMAKAYTDGHFQLVLLSDSLPSKEIVKRYNRYRGESGEDEKLQESRNRKESGSGQNASSKVET